MERYKARHHLPATENLRIFFRFFEISIYNGQGIIQQIKFSLYITSSIVMLFPFSRKCAMRLMKLL